MASITNGHHTTTVIRNKSTANSGIAHSNNKKQSKNKSNAATLKVYLPFAVCCMFIASMMYSLHHNSENVLYSSSSSKSKSSSITLTNPTISSSTTKKKTTNDDIDHPSYYDRNHEDLDNESNDDDYFDDDDDDNDHSSSEYYVDEDGYDDEDEDNGADDDDIIPDDKTIITTTAAAAEEEDVTTSSPFLTTTDRNNDIDPFKTNNPLLPPRVESSSLSSSRSSFTKYDLKLPTPIINVGFPKSGTSSIFEFFHCNGLRGQHWYCCEPQHNYKSSTKKMLMAQCMLRNLAEMKKQGKNSNIRIFDGCGTYDVYSEINGPRHQHKLGTRGQVLDDGSVNPSLIPRMFFPQHFHLNIIHEHYPNATFVLHTRPVDTWVKSVLRWNPALKIEFGEEFLMQLQNKNKIWAYQFMDNYAATTSSKSKSNNNNNGVGGGGHHHILNTTITNPSVRKQRITKYRNNYEEFLPWLYQYHTEFIKAFVSTYPSHTLIEVDITKNETGKILGDAFGVNSQCWGNHNKITTRFNQKNAKGVVPAKKKNCRIPKLVPKNERRQRPLKNLLKGSRQQEKVVQTGTCGNGQRGDGICSDGTCCSMYGYCGTTDAHCCD